MEFIIETTYDQPAMKALARGLRKTLRAKRSRRSHILGWIVILLAILLTVASGEFTVRSFITLAAALAILLVFLFEDSLNGHIALKRGIPGLTSALVTFGPEGYHSKTPLGESDFFYENIQVLAETDAYFLFMFGQNHAQVYAKAGMQCGTEDAFRQFIQEKTGKEFVHV